MNQFPSKLGPQGMLISPTVKLVGLEGSNFTGPWVNGFGGFKPQGCHCTKNKCLKAYCVCFKSGKLCGPECQCRGCFSDGTHATDWEIARAKFHLKNPAILDSEGKSQSCNCKNSRCTKAYCVCYAAGRRCTTSCKCHGCNNLCTTVLGKVIADNLVGTPSDVLTAPVLTAAQKEPRLKLASIRPTYDLFVGDESIAKTASGCTLPWDLLSLGLAAYPSIPYMVQHTLGCTYGVSMPQPVFLQGIGPPIIQGATGDLPPVVSRGETAAESQEQWHELAQVSVSKKPIAQALSSPRKPSFRSRRRMGPTKRRDTASKKRMSSQRQRQPQSPLQQYTRRKQRGPRRSPFE
eukprot:jgi/Botrbrau1/17971/Bobra.50_1s0060.1